MEFDEAYNLGIKGKINNNNNNNDNFRHLAYKETNNLANDLGLHNYFKRLTRIYIIRVFFFIFDSSKSYFIRLFFGLM